MKLLNGALALPAVFALASVLTCGACSADVDAAGGTLRVNGSTTVNLVAAEAAQILRDEHGLDVVVDTQGGSSGGITLLGEGRVEVGMSSRPIRDSDRAKHPDADIVTHRIGEDAVALVVSRDVWEGGVRSISAEEMRAVYEGKVTRWSELGGPDVRIAFFNKEPGRGTWEVFAGWLYGDGDDAPAVSFPEVGGNEETRNKVAGTPGALSQLSYAWADGERVFPLAIEDGAETVAPSPATILDGSYPLRRPLLLLTDGPPAGDARTFVEFLLSARGRELVEKHGYVSVRE